MRSIFWKGMLAFVVVILVAVGTVALLAGRVAETEFRRYAMTHGGMWSRQIAELEAYYAEHGSWQGVQDELDRLPGIGMGHRRGRGGEPSFEVRVADARGRIVADTAGSPTGSVSPGELEQGIPIEVDDRIAGYLLPSTEALRDLPLEPSQVQFLERIRTALLVGGLAAMGVALLVGGLLFRSIVHPLRRLTAASQTIARGDLSVRAPVRGGDEVARLARSFNDMADSLARAEAARRNQTADIAHELRTPLTVLRGTLEAMVDGVYPANDENLSAALAQVGTLSRLVDDLRLLALADAGRLTLHRGALNPRRILREMVEAHQPQAQERGISLLLDAPRALPMVLGDRDRLAQVMGNLLGNSLRHVPQGGHIVVQAEARGREVVIRVIDDGPGVGQEDISRLFERFWRGDPARQRATGGSGLGLAIARYIVEAHGGRIWAEATPGGGLTVAFTLPVAALA